MRTSVIATLSLGFVAFMGCSTPATGDDAGGGTDSGADSVAMDSHAPIDADVDASANDASVDDSPAVDSGASDATSDSPDASGPPPCVDGDTSGDLGALGFTRQCTGGIRSYNATVHPTWNNRYSGLMSGDWPGNMSQFGQGLSFVLTDPMHYASFWIEPGGMPTGVNFVPNPSYGMVSIVSVSTVPGDFFGGTAICVNSTISVSKKPGTVAQCRLDPTRGYYFNVALVSYAAPHTPTCDTPPCTVAWTPYLYAN